MSNSSAIKLAGLRDFESAACTKLSREIYDYFSGGANNEITISENDRAYDRIKLRPRILQGVRERDTSVMILEESLSTPICIAPTAFHCLAHKEGELATVKAAVKANAIMMVSMASTVAMEEIALVAKNNSEGLTPKLWFQLYIQPDRELTKLFVKRAEDAEYSALVVTVDSPVFGMRDRDIRNNFHELPDGLSLKNFDSIKSNSSVRPTLEFNSGLTWKDIDWLRSITKLPIFIKGVLCGEDAQLAIQHGVDGIIVSNHGGRQLDTLPATIDVLPEIANAVEHKIPIIIDGGIRRGTDVVKALALGADAIAVGRPILWGLAVNGEQGVCTVLKMLQEELTLAMALCNCSSIKEIKKSLLYSIL
ncbi:alpha-hydroxy acid oxidase [Aquimarina longa]|uniref:alpha-hydroxy acid oxidase n=1 Tax=Aquimarina longa TaxID=1080221 RepID=UPI0007804012|nr:alpha-hydroxy acid oxidase [Aquimarina longa]